VRTQTETERERERDIGWFKHSFIVGRIVHNVLQTHTAVIKTLNVYVLFISAQFEGYPNIIKSQSTEEQH